MENKEESNLLLYNADNEKVFVLICVFCGELIIKKKPGGDSSPTKIR